MRERTKHGAIVQKGKRTLMIPRPHGAQRHPVYVRKVIRSIEEDDE
ncbi:MAG: hypothetical protein M3O91_00905 [Chloroflexota bacterium]|nr:hypothetical protein [Chloroflexota bacterium]